MSMGEHEEPTLNTFPSESKSALRVVPPKPVFPNL